MKCWKTHKQKNNNQNIKSETLQQYCITAGKKIKSVTNTIFQKERGEISDINVPKQQKYYMSMIESTQYVQYIFTLDWSEILARLTVVSGAWGTDICIQGPLQNTWHLAQE